MTTNGKVRERRNPPMVSIRLLREAHGLSQAGLADRIEPHLGKRPDPDTISNVENGWKRPSPQLMHAWAKALKISPLDVFTDEPETQTAPAA